MGLNCGIVGLPNVGKSTLFNALTRTAAAAAENYPFCTVEPNVGRVPVPDPRLERIHAISNSTDLVPTYLEFVDIAGLVRGASKGEGLGNQFLAHIREVDAIVMVLRCFENPDIVHVEGAVDPLRDAETVETELMLADLESLERRMAPLEKKAAGGDREAKAQLAVIRPALAALAEGRPARSARIEPAQRRTFERLHLLTAKPVLYVANVDENSAGTGNAWSAQVEALARERSSEAIVVAAAIEAEIARLTDEGERREFLASLGLAEAGLDRLVRAGYRLLDLITFFTTGPKETRAWTIRAGTTAAAAAGAIHSDMERGFIAAETISFEDFVAFGGEQEAKEAGRMRLEGRDYVVRDGDVIRFRFNV